MKRFSRQRGLSLATALFVITVMALLAVVTFRLVRNNAETTQEEILLVRAFYAAESGAQIALNAAFPPDGTGEGCPVIGETYTFTSEVDEPEGLDQCTAEILRCDYVSHDGNDYYTVQSQGTCGGVSRTVQVRAQ